MPGELIAAFLWAQLEEAREITARRMVCWERYHALLAPLEAAGMLRRPIIPEHCEHNAHMYYVLLEPGIDRHIVLDELKRHLIFAVFHYVPLHSSPAGLRYGRAHGSLAVTDEKSASLIRLPLWIGLAPEQQDFIADKLRIAIELARSA